MKVPKISLKCFLVAICICGSYRPSSAATSAPPSSVISETTNAASNHDISSLQHDHSMHDHSEHHHMHHSHELSSTSRPDDDINQEHSKHAHHGHVTMADDDTMLLHDQPSDNNGASNMNQISKVSSQSEDMKMGTMDNVAHGMGMGHDGHMKPGGMGNMSDMHGMMVFHTGVDQMVLFKIWHITTVGGLIASMIGIALLAMFYEGLKYFREHLFKKYLSSMQFSTVAVTGESGRVTQLRKEENHRILSWAHAIQTSLHVIQIIISYFLMLIFMTYNVWLCLSVVLGAGVGYFIFGWRKATVVDITEHCH